MPTPSSSLPNRPPKLDIFGGRLKGRCLIVGNAAVILDPKALLFFAWQTAWRAFARGQEGEGSGVDNDASVNEKKQLPRACSYWFEKKNQLNDTKRGRSVSNNELWYCNGNSEKKSSRSDYKEVLENKCELFCAKIRHDEYWSGQTYLIFVFPVQSNSALQPKELHSLKKTNKQTNEQNRIILLLAKHVALTVQKWLRFIPSLPGNVWLT